MYFPCLDNVDKEIFVLADFFPYPLQKQLLTLQLKNCFLFSPFLFPSLLPSCPYLLQSFFVFFHLSVLSPLHLLFLLFAVPHVLSSFDPPFLHPFICSTLFPSLSFLSTFNSFLPCVHSSICPF